MRLCLPLIAGLLLASRLAAQGYSPAVAAGKMVVPSGFQVKLVAAEPVVRQPVAIDFDERGRLWVMQYLQYPNPAGLKRVTVDRFSRTAYDRVPEPPPKGPRGADRLTILELDPAKPRAMKARDFVSGLNLASGFAFGHGGVFVLQVPYLLFYPDRDRDGVPDGDPDVLLTGFGMEDAHSVANSLTWGPDGWLYGCQGSTVTARIRGVEFQQGVWRYHPITRRFELFCEGGGNSWGLDFDRHGDLFYSTNHGGFVALHGVQGGYYWKAFGKHGALHHPHAYGYFDHIPHANFQGGHVTVGGIFYRGDNFPAAFRDTYIAADLLGHGVHWHSIEPAGSSFRTRHGGDLLSANDSWFAPSDVCLGPDGCVYVADWHDRRTAHPDPDADWDRTNGRIYRISHGEPPAVSDLDLATKTSADLVRLLSHPNDWYARTARRILADRRDPEVIFPLRTLVAESKDDGLALQALWALDVSGGFTEAYGRRLLGHRDAHIRRWAVRLLGDEKTIDGTTARALAVLAHSEPSPVVRSQLASTAQRLPPAAALPIVRELAVRPDDAADTHIPLLLWWAIERHALADRAGVTAVLCAIADAPIARTVLLPRLVRRYAAAGTAGADESCVALVRRAADGDRGRLFQNIAEGRHDRPPAMAPTPALVGLVREYSAKAPDDLSLTALLAGFGEVSARDRLWAKGIDARAPAADRVAALIAFGEVASTKAAKNLMTIVTGSDPDAVRLAALGGWQRVGTADQAAALAAAYRRLSPAVRAAARTALFSRPAWAEALVAAVEAKVVPAADVSTDDLRAVAIHGRRDLDERVRRIWGDVKGPTPEARLAEVRRLNNDLRAGSGDAKAGKVLFTKHCAACHKLHGEGVTIGPDLTHANRRDRDFLLVSLVDPSNIIRAEYVSYAAETLDGRVVTGIIAAQTSTEVTFVNAKGEKTTVRQADIAALRASPTSLMPDDLYKLLSPQELRDLFAHLQSLP